MHRRHRLASSLVAVLVTLAACADSPVAPTEMAPNAPSLARRGGSAGGSTSVVACDGSSLALSADEARTLQLHNQERAAKALAPLCAHPALTAAARAHSQEMLRKGYFSHDSFNGDPFYVRLAQFGYSGGSKGENIAWGSGANGAPDPIFGRWKWSAGHYANIASASFTQIGVGVASGRFQSYDDVRMYTVDFGAP